MTVTFSDLLQSFQSYLPKNLIQNITLERATKSLGTGREVKKKKGKENEKEKRAERIHHEETRLYQEAQ